jgi:hypothetical protein
MLHRFRSFYRACVGDVPVYSDQGSHPDTQEGRGGRSRRGTPTTEREFAVSAERGGGEYPGHLFSRRVSLDCTRCVLLTFWTFADGIFDVCQILRAVLTQGVLFMSKEQFEQYALAIMMLCYRLSA